LAFDEILMNKLLLVLAKCITDETK